MSQTAILLLSDNPALPTGLARITRDLATRIGQMPEFRVGTLGRAGLPSRALPWAQYTFAPTEQDQWGATHIEATWRDFAGEDEPGIVFSILDPSRVLWLGQPRVLGDNPLSKWLKSMRRWGYFPIDSTGPGDRLSGSSCMAAAGFDRKLAYTQFGKSVLSRSVGTGVDWIPHGIDATTFQPRAPMGARMAMGIKKEKILIGCVMTNQPRKDWGAWACMAARLKASNRKIQFWLHTDVLLRAWDIAALIEDYGLEDVVKATLDGDLTDEDLSYYYSACDLTILPSLGEGFGYPIAESLACGTPCLHIDYAGGAELLPEQWRLPAAGWRLDSPYNCSRPLLDPAAWADRIMQMLDSPKSDAEARALVEHLDWNRLWPATWEKWLHAGLEAK